MSIQVKKKHAITLVHLLEIKKAIFFLLTYCLIMFYLNVT